MKVFNWSAEKNEMLISERGVSFEDAVFHIQAGGLLDEIVHHNIVDYTEQRIFIVLIADNVYLVPYVEDEDQVFLKTIIPSRKFTRMYLGELR